MEHKELSLEFDKNLIERVLDDINMRYIILFLYIVRNDLFKDLSDENLIQVYEHVISLDDIFKKNVTDLWDEDFIEIIIDLGLFKNIRSIREFKQKDDDFILKMGEETITIEQNTILVPDDTLYSMIHKKFNFISRRNFNDALTRLKAIRCEVSGVIHPFIFQIGENDYCLADDLYYILDQYGNIYQAIKIEITIEEFYKRFKDIMNKIIDFINIFDTSLTKKNTIKKICRAIEEDKDLIKFLKKEKIKLSDKFTAEDIDKEAEIYKKWSSTLNELLNFMCQINKIDAEINDLRNIYSGKNKKYSYLEFIEKVSFNEDDIVDKIQEDLIKLRERIIKIKESTSKFTKKELKILNLDYERFLIMSEDSSD
ncbi:MAG: hypothetical protein ACTSPW_07785 [Promethearchaeota archaeon]